MSFFKWKYIIQQRAKTDELLKASKNTLFKLLVKEQRTYHKHILLYIIVTPIKVFNLHFFRIG